MPVRRKSTERRTPKNCAYHEQFLAEHANQQEHDQRQSEQPDHDLTPCWCCCDDCADLTWYFTPRKGVWWARLASGELQSMRESYGERRGSPVISPSSSRTLSPPRG